MNKEAIEGKVMTLVVRFEEGNCHYIFDVKDIFLEKGIMEMGNDKFYTIRICVSFLRDTARIFREVYDTEKERNKRLEEIENTISKENVLNVSDEFECAC